jgi:hypothetical protein
MSRLDGRIRRLQARYGGCPGCAERPPIVGFSCPSRPWRPDAQGDVSSCPDCGQPRDVTIIRLAFDWGPDEETDRGGLSAAQSSGSERKSRSAAGRQRSISR